MKKVKLSASIITIGIMVIVIIKLFLVVIDNIEKEDIYASNI